MGQSNWKSVKVKRVYCDRINALCDGFKKLGFAMQPAQHTNEAMDNYMNDVFETWEAKLKKAEKFFEKV